MTLIPHTHIESSDKHNIRMQKGDRFGWLLEEENPVVELLSSPESSAGLCAYMWDAHFGYRACRAPGNTTLPAGSRYEASVRITRISRAEGEALIARGIENTGRSPADPSLYRGGQHVPGDSPFAPRAATGCLAVGVRSHGKEPHTATGELDARAGYDDDARSRSRPKKGGADAGLQRRSDPHSGAPPFADGKMYRLSAFACSSSLKGAARLGLRIHRERTPGLWDTRTYELYRSRRKSPAPLPGPRSK